MKFSSQELFSLPRNLRAGIIAIDRQKRHLLPDKDYYAVVYEYIPNDMTPLDDTATQEVFDFFWSSGFTSMDIREENWLGGIVLDMASFINPVSCSWSRAGSKRIDVKVWPENFFYGPSTLDEANPVVLDKRM